MNLEFVELELDWPLELSLFDLKTYILSKLIEYGEPLRWAITSVTTHPDPAPQKIYVEAVVIINQDRGE